MSSQGIPVFFIHIMRTGGTSLRRMLWSAQAETDTYPARRDLDANSGQYPEIAVAAQHLRRRPAPPSLVVGHYPYVMRDLLPRSTRIVSLLRDPVDRSVSVLRRARRRNPAFAEWSLEEIFEQPRLRNGMIANYQTKVFAFRHLSEAKSVNIPMKLRPWRLKLALENLEDCDIVGVTDRFADIVRRLDTLGIPHGEPLHVNTARGTDPDPSPALIERITDVVDLDQQLYASAVALSGAHMSIKDRTTST